MGRPKKIVKEDNGLEEVYENLKQRVYEAEKLIEHQNKIIHKLSVSEHQLFIIKTVFLRFILPVSAGIFFSFLF